MKNLEKTLAVIIVVALILKFNMFTGSDSILFVTMSILPILYYPFGFLLLNQIRFRNIFRKTAYKDVTAVQIIIAVATGMGMAIIVIGSLFKLLHYEGADQMLLIGLVQTLIMSIITLARMLLGKDANSRFILLGVAGIGFVGVVLLTTSELQLVKLQYRDHPEYVRAYADYINDKTNDELFVKVELERNRILLDKEEFENYKKSLQEHQPEMH